MSTIWCNMKRRFKRISSLHSVIIRVRIGEATPLTDSRNRYPSISNPYGFDDDSGGWRRG